MKARKLTIHPWLSCPYNKNTPVDLPSVEGKRSVLRIVCLLDGCEHEVLNQTQTCDEWL